MSDSNKGLDPQIANLIGLGDDGDTPDFNELLRDSSPTHGDSKVVDLSIKTFDPIYTIMEEPKPYFFDRDFYRKAVTGEGELSKKFHEHFTSFLDAKDPQDRSMYRNRTIPAYWDLVSSIAGRVGGNLTIFKKMVLRFGLLSPTFLDGEQRNMLSRIIEQKTTREPVYYLDEWLFRIAKGLESVSATDEVTTVKKDSTKKLLDKLDRARGSKESELTFLHNKIRQRSTLEAEVGQCLQEIRDHSFGPSFEGVGGPYSDHQKRQISKVTEIFRQLVNLDKDISRTFTNLQNLTQSVETLEKRTFGMDAGEVDSSVVIGEFHSIRQMHKLCVGRKGNHFPILMKSYIRPNIRELGIRENVINEMAFVEGIDSRLFFRTFKNQTSRIVPNVIILPCYGESGICWEPFERRNRATSRGRVAIPLFPKNLRVAVIAAMGDIRWQVAKEKALHYWMEEGLTGQYYQWFSDKKKRGDVRQAFIDDYILWITRESVGIQKLDKEVRGIFWRLIPFPQRIKDDLKNRGYVYNELYKKDINISMSDGY